MNEETRLTLELEQAYKRLRQARENTRLARREQTPCTQQQTDRHGAGGRSRINK